MRLATSLLSIAAILAIAPSAHAQLPSSYWQFNEGAGTTANDAFGSDNGMLQNGAAFGAPRTGTTGSSLNLNPGNLANNGTATVQVPGNTFAGNAVANNAITFSFWQAANTQPQADSSFWVQGGPGDRAAQAHVPWSNGQIFFDTNGCCGGSQRQQFTPPAPFNTQINQSGLWNHFAFVKNGSNKQVYINGTLVNSKGGQSALPAFVRLWIGSAQNGGNNYNGSLDDFAVFDRALSGAEINEIISGNSTLSVSQPSVDFGNVRYLNSGAGTTAASAISVENSGDLLSELSGNIGLGGANPSQFTLTGGGAFGTLFGTGTTNATNQSVSPTVSFDTPTTRGSFSASLDVTSNAGDSSVALSGQGVGPVFDSNHGTSGTLDFGIVSLGNTPTIALDISNISTDVGLGNLSDLTISQIFSITGANASEFELIGLTSDEVLSAGGGDVLNLLVQFSPDFPLGAKSATLTLNTDQGAPFGSATSGDTFSFQLTAVAIPEPSSIAIWALLALGLAGMARFNARRYSK